MLKMGDLVRIKHKAILVMNRRNSKMIKQYPHLKLSNSKIKNIVYKIIGIMRKPVAIVGSDRIKQIYIAKLDKSYYEGNDTIDIRSLVLHRRNSDNIRSYRKTMKSLKARIMSLKWKSMESI